MITKNQICLDSFTGNTDMELFANAIEFLKQNPDTTLIVPPRTYNITSELAREAQYKVMKREYGSNPQDVMFNPHYKYTRGIHLDGLKNCKIKAYNALILVDGFMEPISITNCENVEVSGLAIDHKRKPYSMALVTDCHIGEDGLQHCTLELEQPVFKETYMHLRTHFYSPSQGRVLHEVGTANDQFIDEYHIKTTVTAGKLEDGDEFYGVHTYHSRPAILIEYSKDVYLTDVTIHSQPGMGVVGNRSENIIMTRLNVVPSHGHHMSTNTDATHFTSIKGLLKMKDCKFIAQGDDFVNAHGYYHAIVKRDAPNIVYLQEKTPDGTHAQTLDYPDVGDTMELSDITTLKTLDSFTVVDVVPMVEEWMCKVTLDRDLPEDTTGLVMADVTRLPEVEVTGCYAAEHFARSVLIKTRKATIENNIFRDIFGTAIAVASESYWYEGVNPANVTIRNNVIICNEDAVGKVAGIYVYTDCKNNNTYGIRNVTIENNVIYAPKCSTAVLVRNVDGLTVKNNVCTTLHKPIEIATCKNIDVDFDL